MFEKCFLHEDEVIEGRPVGEHANLHPYGHATDPFVSISAEGTFVMDLNYPVRPPGSRRWWTAVYQALSRDGVRWFAPQPLSLPEFQVGKQFETPCRLPTYNYSDMPIRARAAYRKVLHGDGTYSMRDTVEVTHGSRLLTTFEPTDDLIFEDPDGNVRGGYSEPSLLAAGPFLVCVLQELTYADGKKPSLVIAASTDQGVSWLMHDTPILTDSYSDVGVGQPQVHAFRGGYLVVWQNRIKGRMAIHAIWTPNWLDWSAPIELFSNTTEEWRGRISGPCFVEKDGKAWIYFFGWPELEPERRVHWIARRVIDLAELEALVS